jgi:hypothetical protein
MMPFSGTSQYNILLSALTYLRARKSSNIKPFRREEQKCVYYYVAVHNTAQVHNLMILHYNPTQPNLFTYIYMYIMLYEILL